MDHDHDFQRLIDEVMASADRFGHREHIHLTWLAIRAQGTDAAVAMISQGLRRTARYAGAPQKYNATLSRAWVELIGHHIGDEPDFATFLKRHPRLLDKRLIGRHYRARTLAGAHARTGWVAPDLAPFPWHRP